MGEQLCEQKGLKRRLLDVEEVAQLLGMTPTWVRNHCRDRVPVAEQVPHIRLGKYLKFASDVIERWIANGCRPLPQEKVRLQSGTAGDRAAVTM